MSRENLSFFSDPEEDEELVDSEGDVVLPDESFPPGGTSKSLQSDYGYGDGSENLSRTDLGGSSYHQTRSMDAGPESWEVVENQGLAGGRQLANDVDLSESTLDAMLGYGQSETQQVQQSSGTAKARPTTAAAYRRPVPTYSEDNLPYPSSHIDDSADRTFQTSYSGRPSESFSTSNRLSNSALQQEDETPGNVTYASGDTDAYDAPSSRGNKAPFEERLNSATAGRPMSASSERSARSYHSSTAAAQRETSNSRVPTKESSATSQRLMRVPSSEREDPEARYPVATRDTSSTAKRAVPGSTGPSRPPSATKSSRPPSASLARPQSATSTRPSSAGRTRPPSAGSARPPAATSGSESRYSHPSDFDRPATATAERDAPVAQRQASTTSGTGYASSTGTHRTTSASRTGTYSSATGQQSRSEAQYYSSATYQDEDEDEDEEEEDMDAASEGQRTPSTSRPMPAGSPAHAPRDLPPMPSPGRAQSGLLGRAAVQRVASPGEDAEEPQPQQYARPASPNPYDDPYDRMVYEPPAYDSQPAGLPSSPLWVPGGQPRAHRPLPPRPTSSRSSPSPRARPTSASRRSIEIQEIMDRSANTWDVRDVCVWVDHIGMGQYRKRFAHNCIDGRLLLALTDEHLKIEIGIGPLGHRHAILEQIHILATEGGAGPSPRRLHYRPQSAPAQRPRRPASASNGVIPPDSFLGPASGRVTVYEQQAKLVYDLNKARARAAHKRSEESHSSVAALQAEDEVKRLAGQLQDLEKKHALVTRNSFGSLDTDARIPWHPVGLRTRVTNEFPERRGKIGDHPSVEETFQPQISKESKKMMREAQGNYVAPKGKNSENDPFLMRLKNDEKKRNSKLKELESKFYSKEAIQGSAETVMRQKQRDLAFLSEIFEQRFHSTLPDNAGDRESALNDVIEDMLSKLDGGSESKNGAKQQERRRLNRILKLKGDEKLSAVVGIFRTQLFMDRYSSDLRSKVRRLQDLERGYYMQVFKGRTKEDLASNDLQKCYKWFAMLGWGDPDEGPEPVSDERLSALLKRVGAYKVDYDRAREKEREKPREQQRDPAPAMDWSAPQWRRDSLDDLQERQMASIVSALEREAEARAAAQKPSAVDEALGKSATITASIPPELMPRNHLHYTIRMLARCRQDDLQALEAATGQAKRLAVFRAIRTQQFLEYTSSKMAEKEAKEKEIMASMSFPSKVVSKEQLDEFYERLVGDAIKRRERIEKAMSDKMQKEMEILKSSVLFNRANRRRPASART